MSGPVVPSPGDVATFNGNPLPDYRNLPLNSSIYIINGTDPYSAQEVYNNLQGLRSNGDQFINPITLTASKFPYSGDPVTATGWNDASPSDKRTMISMGPISFAPGDSQQVVLKFAAAPGADPLTALSALRQSLYTAAPPYPPPSYVSCDSATVAVNNFGELANVYFNGNPPWLNGYNWGGDYYNYGADLAEKLLGSNLTVTELNDVEIRFSRNLTQFGYRYLWNSSPALEYGGYYEVPFTVWDKTNNRQLNVLFTEDAGSTVFDSTWGPAKSNIEADGGREIMVITNSDYSGYHPEINPFDYQNVNLTADADNLDLQYVLWPVVRSYYNLSDLHDGQKLEFLRQTNNPNGLPDTLRFEIPQGQDKISQPISISCFGSGNRILKYSLLSGDRYSVLDHGATYDGDDVHETSVALTSFDDGEFTDMLQVSDVVSGTLLKEVALVGTRSSNPPKAILEPDTMRYFFQFAIDTVPARCYFGDFDDGHTSGQVNLPTVELTTPGGLIQPIEVQSLPGHGAFQAGVIGYDFDAREFVASYGVLLGKQYQPYTISGNFLDGEPFEIASQVVMTGHLPGDINFDGKVSASDAVLIVNYIFDGGNAPDPLAVADIDGNQRVSIGDAVYLLRYIFAAGPPPCGS